MQLCSKNVRVSVSTKEYMKSWGILVLRLWTKQKMGFFENYIRILFSGPIAHICLPYSVISNNVQIMGKYYFSKQVENLKYWILLPQTNFIPWIGEEIEEFLLFSG